MSERSRSNDAGMSRSAVESGWSTYPADHWHEHKASELLYPMFWRHCAEKYGGPILDLCCGNGRYAIALAEHGHEVVGVDINEGMIARAKEWAGQRARSGPPSNVSFQLGDVVKLDLGRQFRLAILPGWSFQVFLTRKDQLSFLGRVREHLVPGGAFAFNVFVPFNRQRGLGKKGDGYGWPRDPDYHSGAPRAYDPASQIETLVESNIHPIKLRHTSLSELELLFRLTGFEIAELYGDDGDMRPFTGKGDDDYTILARRRRAEARL